MGMRMRASALRSISSGRPAPSLPTRRATGWHQSTSQGARSEGAASPEGDALKRAPTTASDSWAGGTACRAPTSGGGEPTFSRTLEASVRMPAILNCVKRMARDTPARIGRLRAAPAEARSAFAEYGLAVPLTPEAAVAGPVAPKGAAGGGEGPPLPGPCPPPRQTRGGAEEDPGGWR